MRRGQRFRYRLTEGERSLALAYFLVAIVGAGMGYLAAMQLSGGGSLLHGLSLYERWIVLSSGIGAMAGLYLSGDRMSRSGRFSLRRAVSGAVYVSFVGAIIAGTLSLPLYGTMFGPFTLIMTLITSPAIALVWAAHLLGIHVLMTIHMRERDSLFMAAKIGANDLPERQSAQFVSRSA